MKISQDENTKNYLKKLHRSQLDIINNKENEIKKVNNHYNQKVKESKSHGEVKLLDQQEKNKLAIIQSIDEKEKRLEGVREGLKETYKKLQTEKENLDNTHKLQIDDLNTVSSEKYRDLFNKAAERSQEINELTSEKIGDLQFESDQNIKDMTHKVAVRSNDFARASNKVLRDQERNYNIQRKNNEKDLRTRILQQKKDHLDKVDFMTRRNKIEINQRKSNQMKELTFLEDHHKEVLKQKELSFKEKFSNMEKSHTSLIKRVQERFDSQMQSLVNKYGKYKANKTAKADDEFYNVTKLKPTITSDEKDYIISLKIPEYEQEQVNLTAQERKVSLTLTRSFSDVAHGENGEINKSRRSEVLNKALEVPDILDPKTIKRKYEDGVLSFIVSKR